MTKILYCFKCRKEIHPDNDEFYVFLDSLDNNSYCIKCHEQDIEDMKELDPFITPFYDRNFIRMNKDD